MFDIGPEKLMLILLVALIVLGPNQLPDTARKIGTFMAQLRRMADGVHAEVRSSFEQVTTQPQPTAPTDPDIAAPNDTAA